MGDRKEHGDTAAEEIEREAERAETDVTERGPEQEGRAGDALTPNVEAEKDSGEE